MMRIGIREQLGLLVLLTTLVALAVVAVATVIPNFLEWCDLPPDILTILIQWVTNYNFVIGIR